MSSTRALTELTYAVHCGDPRVVGEMLGMPGAVLTGHYVLLSGLHSSHFVAFSRIAESAEALDRIADWIAPSLGPLMPDALIAPSTAGVGLGWSLARRLGLPLHLASLGEAGRATGVLGAPDVSGQRIALVNDVVTTGQGLAGLAAVVKAAGAMSVGAAWFASREDVDIETVLGLPAIRVADVPLPAWHADGCELCRQDIPLERGIDLN